MVNAHLDNLELELRKLDGVRTVGFASQHDVLYIQLFVDSSAQTASIPFEATRIAQRHSSSPVAVELVRWTNLISTKNEQGSGLGSIFENTNSAKATMVETEVTSAPKHAGSIGTSQSAPIEEPVATSVVQNDEPKFDDEENHEDNLQEEPTDSVGLSYPEVVETEQDEEQTFESAISDDEVDLASEEIYDSNVSKMFEANNETKEEPELIDDRREEDSNFDRIALLLVTTSSENDEIEVHLAFDELRTIGRAASNRGLLGAIDATVQAISELTGSDEFHAEWARSLEPGAEHASLVAVGLTNSGGTDTRHGIAGGSSPIEAAARATLNALNRTAVLAVSEQ